MSGYSKRKSPINSQTAPDPSNVAGSGTYAWKPGDADSRLLGSVPCDLDALLVMPSPSGAGEMLYATLTDRGSQAPFTLARLDVAR